jgi:hypothetical protein
MVDLISDSFISRRKVMVPIVLAILLITGLFSCSCDKTGKYKEIIVDEGVHHFSFEYPNFYDKPRWTVNSTSCEVKALGAFIEPGVGLEFLFINYFPVDNEFPDFTTHFEYVLKRMKAHFDDFTLIERGSMTIDGLKGESALYSYTGSDFYTVYTANFQTNNTIWDIKLIADKFVIDQAKSDFSHILESFKILN